MTDVLWRPSTALIEGCRMEAFRLCIASARTWDVWCPGKLRRISLYARVMGRRSR